MDHINIDGASSTPLSESMQMYLVTIARLRDGDRPVPLSQLADALSVSPVSVNEMCRKLQGLALVVYQPYKGASLTPEGAHHAHSILRRHRLWEVFLVEKLGFEYASAHETACQLEHSTPNAVADRLDAFLEYPAVNPQGDPIPQANGDLPAILSLPLASLSAGQRGHVIHCDASDTVRSYMDQRGLRPGAEFSVLATSGDSILVQVGEQHISLARTLAETVQVEVEEIPGQAASDVPVCSGR